MKKALTILLTAVMLLGLWAPAVMAADVAPKFSEKFFPSGKANVPTDIYYQISRDDSGRAKNVYVWLTQPEDVIGMFAEWSYLGRDEFEKTYGCTIEKNYLQIDCKVDNGNWHYVSEWDKDEYPQANQPYDLMIRQKIVASKEQKTYREGCALIDPWYGQDDESAGYLKPIVYSKDDRWYLDLENHSLTLRMRYIIAYTNWNMTDEEREAAGGENTAFILSDWSEEITIGKDATQKELVYPEAIEAPSISELTFVESVERGDGYSDTAWKLYVDFPKSNGDAQKYYTIEMGADESFVVTIFTETLQEGKFPYYQLVNSFGENFGIAVFNANGLFAGLSKEYTWTFDAATNTAVCYEAEDELEAYVRDLASSASDYYDEYSTPPKYVKNMFWLAIDETKTEGKQMECYVTRDGSTLSVQFVLADKVES